MMDTEMPSQVRLHATVTGRVQGVSFRYFVLEQASHMNIKGWVRNRYDGSVEVMAEGARQELENLLRLLSIGPPMASVDTVTSEWLSATGEFTSFWVRATG
jgi:acylphosphatase